MDSFDASVASTAEVLAHKRQSGHASIQCHTEKPRRSKDSKEDLDFFYPSISIHNNSWSSDILLWILSDRNRRWYVHWYAIWPMSTRLTKQALRTIKQVYKFVQSSKKWDLCEIEKEEEIKHQRHVGTRRKYQNRKPAIHVWKLLLWECTSL